MAGLGRRTFAPGEVLTASNVMNYLMDQSVMSFAGTAARGSAIGTAASEGMISYLADSDFIEIYNGSSWLPTVSPAAWTVYTPTISSANGALSIGNGIVSFRYKQVGKTVFVIGKYTLGTTSTLGNTFDITMPTSIQSNITIATPLGKSSYWDNGSAIYEGWGLQISSNSIRLVVSTVSGTRITNNEVSAGVPMTWNSGDVVFFHGFYEAA